MDKQEAASCQGSGFVVLRESREQLSALFTDGFMRANTNFETFTQFMFSGAVFVNWNAVPIMGPEAAFDYCVKGKSVFASWQDMYTKALEQRLADDKNQ